MNAILEQLGIDQTFFVQLFIFAVVFLILSNVFFKPFLYLFEVRHKKTVEDREAAEKLMLQAQSKFDEYKSRISEERQSVQKEIEAALESAKKEEAAILSQARAEAKKLVQEAVDSASAQREELRKQLEVDVEGLSRQIAEKLLARKA